MANANKRRFGPAARGKKSGSGAKSVAPKEMIEENVVLSNRDKSRHSGERGLDSKSIQTDQYQDHSGNRLKELPDDTEQGA